MSDEKLSEVLAEILLLDEIKKMQKKLRRGKMIDLNAEILNNYSIDELQGLQAQIELRIDELEYEEQEHLKKKRGKNADNRKRNN